MLTLGWIHSSRSQSQVSGKEINGEKKLSDLPALYGLFPLLSILLNCENYLHFKQLF